MARLVAHLGDPPRHESLFTFPTCPNSYALLKSIVVAECVVYIPQEPVEGRGQMNLDLKRVKELNRHISGVVK